MGRVAKTREPLVIPHYQEWAGRSQKYTVATFQSVLAAPLMIGTRLVGVIAAVHSDPRHSFGEEGLRLINLFASQAAVAIENARLFTSERKRAEEQQALLDTLSDLSGELELSKVLSAVLNRAIKLLGVTGGGLATYDQRKEELRIAAGLNLGVDSAGAGRRPAAPCPAPRGRPRRHLGHLVRERPIHPRPSLPARRRGGFARPLPRDPRWDPRASILRPGPCRRRQATLPPQRRPRHRRSRRARNSPAAAATGWR